MMSTGVILAVGFQLSGGDSQMNTLMWYSWLGGVIIGTMIGANMVLEDHSKAGPRNVVITGSTQGLGKALAREFLLSGDRVVIASRSSELVDTTVEELNENLEEGMDMAGSRGKTKFSHAKVVGIACDVCNPDDVRKLAKFAVSELGGIDIWIVSTNLVGSLICTREAMHIMQSQDKGGHVFNMDGAGSGGSSTPLTAVYGSTKCGLRLFPRIKCQLCLNREPCPSGGRQVGYSVPLPSGGRGLDSPLPHDAVFPALGGCSQGFSSPKKKKCGLRQLQASLLKECMRSKVGVHTASPGMVLTDLLLSGSTLRNKQMFNIICELPEQWRDL